MVQRTYTPVEVDQILSAYGVKLTDSEVPTHVRARS